MSLSQAFAHGSIAHRIICSKYERGCREWVYLRSIKVVILAWLGNEIATGNKGYV